jgi:hypothetical protein
MQIFLIKCIVIRARQKKLLKNINETTYKEEEKVLSHNENI